MSFVAVSPARFTARQRTILFVLLGAGFMLSTDFSMVNRASPGGYRRRSGNGGAAVDHDGFRPAATQSTELSGMHVALGVDVAVTLTSVVLILARLRPGSKTEAAPIADHPSLSVVDRAA